MQAEQRAVGDAIEVVFVVAQSAGDEGHVGGVFQAVEGRQVDALGPQPGVAGGHGFVGEAFTLFAVGDQDVGQGGLGLRAGQLRLGVGCAALIEDNDVAAGGKSAIGLDKNGEDLEGVAAGAALGQQQRVGRAAGGAANGHGHTDGRAVGVGVAQGDDDVAAVEAEGRAVERRRA